MPNWCNNNITIQGSTETIKTLWEEASAEDGGLLSAMVPMPKALEGTTSPTPQEGASNYEGEQPVVDGYDNWYDWSVARWGTKWDVSTEGLEFTDNGDGTASISGWFDSAWAPPLTAYETFCEDMDGVYIEASYHEGGMDFGGFWDSETGEEHMDGIQETWEQYKDNLDDAPSLFKRIDEEYGLSDQYAEWEEMEDA
jgi:hypothetical protein